MKPDVHAELCKVYQGLPEARDLIRGGGFLHGRPMVDTGIEIETCGGAERPAQLYRVIHADQPFGGIEARGSGSVQINPLYFQVLVQKHLNRNCRYPSPFLSVTNSLDKAKVVAAVYEARGFSGIEIVHFDSTGLGWNQKERRLWDATYLVEKFQTPILKGKGYLEQEFLLEYAIPKDSVTRRDSWESVRETLDPGGLCRRRIKTTVKNQKNKKRKVAASTDDAKIPTEGTKTKVDGGEAVGKKRKKGSKRTTDFKLRV
ncbi:hypothetical protein GGR52DRAFT_541681 [Hypoxylon sp. FL1284]|nr:hypothetical protein GGR52DRAFT_541681 [Hypoxylon sp. FL1284]